jgi:hypothetical protein
LGLALVAVFAMGAMAASAASATDTFTSPKATSVITAEGTNNRFEITSSGTFVECTLATFKGTVTGTAAKEVTVYPTYKGVPGKTPHTGKCKTNLGDTAEPGVHMNGCAYVLTGNTTKEDPVGKKDAVVWIQCPPKQEITITGPGGCTIHVPEQTPTEGGVTYTNELDATAKKWDVLVHATVTGITYTTNFNCQLVGIAKEGNDSDYTGTVTVKSFEDKCKVEAGKDVECPFAPKNAEGKEIGETDEFTDGSQIDLTFSET